MALEPQDLLPGKPLTIPTMTRSASFAFWTRPGWARHPRIHLRQIGTSKRLAPVTCSRNAACFLVVTTLHFSGVTAARAGGFSSAGDYQTLVVDRDFSMSAGVQNLLLAEHLFARAENAILPPRLGAERNLGGKSLGIGYRLARLTLVDYPTIDFSRVVLHEVFGHGARLREFDWPDSYSLEFPPPFGPGGGATITTIPEEATFGQRMAFWTGGVEANNLTGQTLMLRWVALDRVTYHEALRYLRSQLDQFVYIQRGGGEEGNDIDRYLADLGEANAGSGYPPVERDDLRRGSLIGLVNPFSWYSAYAVLGAHVIGGRDTLRVPTLKVGDVHYIPAFGYGLSPFGPEFHFGQLFRRHNRVLAVDLRIGAGHSRRTWGLAIEGTNVLQGAPLGLDARVALWHQPSLEPEGIEASLLQGRLGGLATITTRWQTERVRVLDANLGSVVEVGYKTRGFLGGERLDRGMILRVGLGLYAPMANL